MEKGLEHLCPVYITTDVVAEYCGMSKVTVLRWIEKEYLTAFRLPESHHRIHRDDFDKFLAKHGLPIHKQMFKEGGDG